MIILGNKQCINYINLVPSKKQESNTETTEKYFYCWKGGESVNGKLYWTEVENPTSSDVIYGGLYFVNSEVYADPIPLTEATFAIDGTITFKEGPADWDWDVTVTRDSSNDGTYVLIDAYEQDGFDDTKPGMIHKSPTGQYYTMIETEEDTYYTDVDAIINFGEIVDNGDNTITYDGATYTYDETPSYHRKEMLENKGLI